MNSQTALITGASSGIGLHLAREFAAHGHPVVLVAPVEEELQAVANAITTEFGVRAMVIPADLTDPEAPQRIFDELFEAGININVLVNNAGVGQVGKFWEVELERSIEMLRLNIEAVVRLTHLFLPPMIAHGGGKILNTASVAGFEPGPNFAVYSATKAFVLSLSEALTTETEGTGVTVTALCPGPTDTDFFQKADMMDTRGVQKMKVMPPQDVAHEGYEALYAEDRVHVAGIANKIMVASRRIMPIGAQAKLNESLYEDVPKDERQWNRGDEEFTTEHKHTHS